MTTPARNTGTHLSAYWAPRAACQANVDTALPLFLATLLAFPSSSHKFLPVYCALPHTGIYTCSSLFLQNTLLPTLSCSMLCDSSSPKLPHLIHLSSQRIADDNNEVEIKRETRNDNIWFQGG